MIFNYGKCYIKCNEINRSFNINSVLSHDINGITSHYFTMDSINIDINNRKIIFYKFNSNKKL